MTSRSRWIRRILPVAAAAGLAGNGLRLRSRLTSLSVLDAGERQPGRTGGDTRDGPAGGRAPRGPLPDVVVLHVEGGSVEPATVAAAAAHLRDHGFQAVDLVPADLPTEELLDLLRLSDPRQLRGKIVTMARGAGQALVVRGELAERAGLAAGARDPVELRRAFTQAKRYAPRGCDQAIAPGLRAVPLTADQHLSVWRSQYGRTLGMFLPTRLLPAAAAAAGALVRSPLTAAAAAVTAALQPTLVTAGTAARPPDRGRRAATVGRLATGPARLARAVRGRWRPARPAHTDPAFIDTLRAPYEHDIAQGVERYLGPERTDCPVCGSRAIRRRTETPDMVQCKPGRFRLDVCTDCGTTFQNPPLTSEGLDFYYRDFYDGLGEFDTEMMFSVDDWLYLKRARMVGEYTRPKRWLDVGGGHGHFSLVASTVYPDARFELLDQPQPVAEAVRRGWVADGHAGWFPDVAPTLDGSFDVVTMFHYLEHTTDPLAELDAAARVLEPGGTLVIEVPAPDSRMADWLGWAWGPWMQPQHLHLLPLDTMVDQLERRGFEVIDTNRGRFYTSWDLSWAVFQLLTRVAPGPNAPWTPPRSPAQRLARLAAFGVAGPVLALALLVDKAVVSPLAKVDPQVSSVFTVIARRR